MLFLYWAGSLNIFFPSVPHWSGLQSSMVNEHFCTSDLWCQFQRMNRLHQQLLHQLYFFLTSCLEMPAVAFSAFPGVGLSHLCSALCSLLVSLWSVYTYSASGQLHGEHFTSHATFLGGREQTELDWNRLCTKCMKFVIPCGISGVYCLTISYPF